MSTTYTKKQLEDIVAGLNVKLESMEKSLSALKDLPTKVSNLEGLLKDSNDKCKSLVETLDQRDKEVRALTLKLNSLEQHHRSWSVRVNSVPINEEDESNIRLVKERVYETALKPILEGAFEMGDITEVPTASQVLEFAHVLPSRDRSKPKTIIARFYSRELRGLVFRHKKAFAPREAATSSAVPNRERPGRYCFPFFDDLTKTNFAKMRALATDPRVDACWSAGGSLRYKLKDSNTVRKVFDVLDSVNNILAVV